jgi:hypothetical protein
MSEIIYTVSADTTSLEQGGKRVSDTFDLMATKSTKAGASMEVAMSKAGQTIQQQIEEEKKVISSIEQDLKRLEKAYESAATTRSKNAAKGNMDAASRALAEEKAILAGLEAQALQTTTVVSGVGAAGAVIAAGITDGASKAIKEFDNMANAGKKAGTEVNDAITKQEGVVQNLTDKVKELQTAYTNAKDSKQKMAIDVELGSTIQQLNAEKDKLNELQVQARLTAEEHKKLGETANLAAIAATENWTKADLKEAIAAQKAEIERLIPKVRELKEANDAAAPGAAKYGKGGTQSQYTKAFNDLEKEKQYLQQLKNVTIKDTKEQQGGIESMVGSLKKWAIGLFSVTAAMKIGKEIIHSTQATTHSLERILNAAGTATQYFFKAIASGDWTNFTKGLEEAIKASVEFTNLMQEIADRRRELQIEEAKTQVDVSKLREATFDKTEGTTLTRIMNFKKMIEMEKELYTKKAEITKDELDGLLKKVAATNNMEVEDLRSFISQYSNYEELIKKGEEYLELKKALGKARQAPEGVQLAGQIENELEALGPESSKAAAYVKMIGKVSNEERTQIASLWAQEYNELNQYNTKTIRFQRQLASARKEIVTAFQTDIDTAKDQTDKLYEDIKKMKIDMIDFGDEKPDTIYRKGLAQAKAEYEADIKGNEWSNDVMAAADKKYQLAKLKLYKEYNMQIHDLATEGMQNVPKAKDVVSSYSELREAERNIQELRKQASRETDEGLKQQILDDIAKEKEYIEELKKLIQEGRFEDIQGNLNPVKLGTSLIGASPASKAAAAEAERIRQKEIDDARFLTETLTEGFYGASDAAGILADAIEETNKELADTLRGISALAASLGSLNQAGLFTGTMSKEDAVSGIISGSLQIISMIATQSAQNKAVMKEYYASIIAQQQQYNLLLNEQLRLNTENNETVFSTDYAGRMKDAGKAYIDAQKKYQEAAKDFNESEAIVGKKNAVSGGNVLKGVGAGAAIGAGIGAFGGPVTLAIGAGIGALVGGIVGLFTKKKKDILRPLLETYPDLISAEGKFNTALAQTLIDNKKVTEETAKTLQNLIEWQTAMEAAHEQLVAVISELAGDLGNGLKTALVDAFVNGTSAAKAFGEEVDKVMENIISNMVFNLVFQKAFEKLQKGMEDSYDPEAGSEYDQTWVDDLEEFYGQAPELIKQFYAGMDAARTTAQAAGFNPFSGTGQQGRLSGAITRTITEDTGTELAGLMRKISDDNRQNMGFNKLTVDELAMAVDELRNIRYINDLMLKTMDQTYKGLPEGAETPSGATVPTATVVTANNIVTRLDEAAPEILAFMKTAAADSKLEMEYSKAGVENLVAIQINTYQTVEELKIAVRELQNISYNTRPVYSGL